MTVHPVSAYLEVFRAARAAVSSSGAQATGTSAYRGPVPPASRYCLTIQGRSCVTKSPSPSSAAKTAARSPPRGYGNAGGSVGQVEYAGVGQPEVCTVIRLVAPMPQQFDDFDGCMKLFLPGGHRVGEAAAHNMLIESLA